jgi:glycine/D-amino acid oxidase-like deaminating enzyme/nitrite reductase/ring-hydroxylating ferredoxin subunit
MAENPSYPTRSIAFWAVNHMEKHGLVDSYPSITHNIYSDFDVAVIGAGWLGLNTALKLHEEGKKVIIIEGKRVGIDSVAAFSTGKVSSQHRIIYSPLSQNFGSDLAFHYAQMNEEAIADMERVINKYKIDCQWTKSSHIIFSETEDEHEIVQQELESAKQSGLNVVSQDVSAELPTTLHQCGNLQVKDQAHLNPVSYLLGIARVLRTANVPIFENSRVKDVSYAAPYIIQTVEGHTVAADKVVIATHLPFLDITGHFAKVKPSRSYCVAFALKDGSSMIKDTYINVNTSHLSRSLRPADDGKLLIVCGAGHPPGELEHPKHGNRSYGYAELEEWTRSYFDVKTVVGRWSALDYFPSDSIPYIGLAQHGISGIYTACGFSKWGFTQGVAAATIITDSILGRENVYEKLFDARRLDLSHSTTNLMKNTAHIAKHFVGDRIQHLMHPIDIEDLVDGEGGICSEKFGRVAVFKDERGTLYKFSAKCTHSGCHVIWNGVEKVFECPCHGSVYSCYGEVLHGPAVKHLPKIEPDQ